LCLTRVLRHTVLVKFEVLLLEPEIFVTEHKARSLVYTLSIAREQHEKPCRVTYMAVTTLIVLPFEPRASLSWKR
jgi:hypothetical protein